MPIPVILTAALVVAALAAASAGLVRLTRLPRAAEARRCVRCGRVGMPRTVAPGPDWLVPALGVAAVLPAYPYALWRRRHARPVCDGCGASHLIAVGTAGLADVALPMPTGGSAYGTGPAVHPFRQRTSDARR